jgi:carboxymethylenebutenolidase
MTDMTVTWDEHIAAEFQTRDADAAVATMTDDATLVHVPMSTGARGKEAIRRFYRDQFIPAWPDDTSVQPLSRTVGADHVVDELLVSCTHERRMNLWLPGIEPTGRHIELLHVAVIRFAGGLIASEHIYWDQASLLVQVGLLDPAGLPVLGVEQSRPVLDPAAPIDDCAGFAPPVAG